MVRATALALVLISTQSLALFDAQLLIGSVSGDIGGTSVKDGSTTDVAAHLDPIPLVPVGFGLRISHRKFDIEGATGSFEGIMVSPEVYAWFPFGSLKPYGKLGWVASGKFANDAFSYGGNTLKLTYDVSASYLGVGVIYSFIPLVGILLEYETIVDGKLKPDLDPLPSADLSTATIFIGVEVGL